LNRWLASMLSPIEPIEVYYGEIAPAWVMDDRTIAHDVGWLPMLVCVSATVKSESLANCALQSKSERCKVGD
jgi:hypothetical protein